MNRVLASSFTVTIGAALAACGTRYADPIGIADDDGGGSTGAASTGSTSDASADAASEANAATGSSASDGGGAHTDSGAGTSGGSATLLPTFCTSDGWCGTTPNFSAIWGTSRDDIWVAATGIGDNPTQSALLHWNGNAWTSDSSFTGLGTRSSTLDAIWGSDPNDVWAAGTQGAMLHWDGARWSPVDFGPYPDEPEYNPSVYGIWGAASDDIFAVGDMGSISHWNGTRWELQAWNHDSSQTLPAVTSVRLTAAWGSASNDVWAVGIAGSIAHWDGSKWSAYQDIAGGAPTTASLYAVWGSAADDVWAVGAGGMVLHWDGTYWTRPNGAVPTTTDLDAVWGSGRDDVWAAGADGTLLHWMGAAWYTAPTKTILGGVVVSVVPSQTVRSLWGSGHGDVWGVGDDSAAVHWNGATWTASPPPSGIVANLNAVWVEDSGTVWAVGDSTVAQWDGTTWRSLGTSTPYTIPGSSFRAVWTNPQSDIWIVGDHGTLLEAPRANPYSYFFAGSGVDLVALGSPDFHAVWGFADNDVWAGGAGGTMLHLEPDRTWRVVPTPTTADIASIWGPAPDDIWAATTADAVLHWDGSTWSSTTVENGTGTRWRTIFGTAADDVWLAGTACGGPDCGSVLRRWNGSSWAEAFPNDLLPSGAAQVNPAWSAARDDLWFVGVPPVFHFAGGNWARSFTGSPVSLNGLSGNAAGDLWGVGANGTILHRAPRGG